MYQNPNGPYGGPDEPYMNETYGQDGGVPYAGGSAYRAPEPGDADFDAPKRRTIFKPRLNKPNFVFSVLVNAVRFLMIVVVLCGLAAAGAEPVAFQISAVLPTEYEEGRLKADMKACAEMADAEHAQIIGGHTQISSGVIAPIIRIPSPGPGNG